MLKALRRDKLTPALTLTEMMIAVVIMAIVFAAVAPQLRAIQNSWASKKANLEVVENGRALMDHITLHLMAAKTITAVSSSTETEGYIEFEDNDGNTMRYDIAANNYVEFGPVGDLADLAGPVSQLQFTCYDACDFDTAIAEPNLIRYVQVQATLTNSAPLGQDRTFTARTYLRTNFNEEVTGYEPYVVIGSAFEFDASAGVSPAICKIDNAHYLCAYQGGGGDGYTVVLTVDTNNWTLSKETPVVFDAVGGGAPALCQIDATHYLCAYEGGGSSGRAVVLTVNLVTWAINVGDYSIYTGGTGQSAKGEKPALYRIDQEHYLCAYRDLDGKGRAVVLEVDTSSWDVSGLTPFVFDSQQCIIPALAKVDETHYLCAYEGQDNDGWAIVLEVDTSSWDVSGLTPFEFDTLQGMGPALAKIDETHYLCAYEGQDNDGWAIVLQVNTSNWNVSGLTTLEFDTLQCTGPALLKVNDSHHLCAYQGDGEDGWAVVLEVDLSDGWNVEKLTPLEFDTQRAIEPALAEIDDSHYLCVYQGFQGYGDSVILGLGPPILP
ncbi:MAG: type II secretion system protein [Planctomycetota bacterium]|nr:MAG: type II secretion system protein [Planctomycetota bacterium]